MNDFAKNTLTVRSSVILSGIENRELSTVTLDFQLTVVIVESGRYVFSWETVRRVGDDQAGFSNGTVAHQNNLDPSVKWDATVLRGAAVRILILRRAGCTLCLQLHRLSILQKRFRPVRVRRRRHYLVLHSATATGFHTFTPPRDIIYNLYL